MGFEKHERCKVWDGVLSIDWRIELVEVGGKGGLEVEGWRRDGERSLRRFNSILHAAAFV